MFDQVMLLQIVAVLVAETGQGNFAVFKLI